MSHIYVQSLADSADLADDLASAERIALDCEAAGFHRYTDRICLVQVTIEDRTYVVDTITFDPSDVLRDRLEDPDVAIVMHGSDFDLRLLSRDLGIRLRGLVDTQVQAAMLGVEGLGLASLLEARFDVRLSKKYQRADWAERPLTEEMLEYAAGDTRYLLPLTDMLSKELEASGRTSWAAEEVLALEKVADEPRDPSEPEDPVTRVKGARELLPRHATALREALRWRDEIAQARDRAPFRVIGDPPLIAAVNLRPRRAEELLDIKGFPRSLAREEGKEFLRRLRAVTEMAEEDLTPFPRGYRRGPPRPPPELEALVDRLKNVRNKAAADIGLPRGTLLANAVLLSIARDAPKDLEELATIDGMRSWKVAVCGERLLEVLAKG